jgi:hypothetical protein
MKMMSSRAGVAMLAVLAAGSCGGDAASGAHEVFFVGYVYDGASGARLSKSTLTTVAISYGDTSLKVDIEDDGRFISRTPLPTWRDYTVKIDAVGFRSFVSYNPGVDVPASVAMTAGVAQASTTQTLDFAAYLFPVSLKSPALALTVMVPDPITSIPSASMVKGTIRLRPQSLSALQISSTLATPANRVWINDEDLLTQTVAKPFTDGTVTVDEGELVYGVSYEIAIYDVADHQPFVATGTNGIVAGLVTSKTFTLVRELRDLLTIVANDAMNCIPPAGTDTTYAAKVSVTFNVEIEVVGATYREDFDNALSITAPTMTGTIYNCPLKNVGADPAQQERGSRIDVSGRTMMFSFNPSVGLAPTYSGITCVPPPVITTVFYQGASLLQVQPVGDPARRRSMSQMMSEKGFSSISCPMRTTF